MARDYGESCPKVTLLDGSSSAKLPFSLFLGPFSGGARLINCGRISAVVLTCILSVSIGSPQILQQQSPRQALVEILSGNQDRLRRHLTPELQARLAEIARNSLQGSESPLEHLQLFKNEDGRNL